jgi:hypothetical protein
MPPTHHHHLPTTSAWSVVLIAINSIRLTSLGINCFVMPGVTKRDEMVISNFSFQAVHFSLARQLLADR